MNTTTQINIEKAANGYIVSVPFQPKVISNEHFIRQQARIMNEEFRGDPALKMLQQSEVEEESTEFKIESTPNVFVFKTMDELIGFLKTYL